MNTGRISTKPPPPVFVVFMVNKWFWFTFGLVSGTSGGGGAQGLVHWMSVMAEHMGGGHHDPSHYALPPWNNGGMDVSSAFN